MMIKGLGLTPFIGGLTWDVHLHHGMTMTQSKAPTRLVKIELLLDQNLLAEIERWRSDLPVTPHRAAALRALLKLGLKAQSGVGKEV